MNRTTFHTVAPVALCALLSFALPQTHLTNLFSKSILSFKNPFAFIAEEGAASADKRIAVWDPDVKVFTKGVAYTPSGAICLLADKGGSLSVLFPPPHGDTMSVLLYSDCYEGAQQSILVSVPSQKKITVLTENDRVLSKSFNITDYTEPDQPFALEIVPRTATGKIVVEKISVCQAPSVASLPAADLLIAFLLFLFFLADTIIHEYRKTFLSWIVVVVSTGLFLAGLILSLNPLTSPWYWLLLLAALVCYRTVRLKAPAREWLAVIFAAGLIVRWNALYAVFPQPLGGDAITYKMLANSFRCAQPLITGIREPLYIWLQAACAYVFGPNGYQFLLPTILLSLGVLLATYRLARTVSGSTATGLWASVFVAINYAVVLMSARGERIELFTLLMLLYCMWIYQAPAGRLWSEIAAGLIAGAICLCWLFGIAGVAILYFLRIACKKVRIPYALAGVFFFAVTLGPFLVSQWQRYGDPFHAVNVGANFYRSAELTGTASLEQGPGTWAALVKKEIGIQKLILRTGAGYFNLFFNPANYFNKVLMGFPPESVYSYFFFPLYVLGLLRELLKKRFWMPAMLLAFINVFPYLLNEIFDFRLLCFLVPFFAYFWASGLVCVLLFSGRLLRRKPNTAAGTIIVNA